MPGRGGHSSLTFLDLDGPGTLTDRLFRAIRAAILEGRVAAGERLPSTRQLATDLGLSRKVVASAYAHLGDEGYLEGRPGAGTFVGASVPDVWPIRAEPVQPERVAPRLRPSRYATRVIDLAPWPPPGARGDSPPLPVDFRYGVPALTDFPQRIWSRLVSRRGQRMSLRSLGYGRTLGLPALRDAIAGYLARARGVTTTPDQIVVVNGSQQALDLLARLLIDAGDQVVCEEPGYQGARQVFQAAGAEVRPIGVDARGLRVADLPNDRRTRLAYVTPSHQFPLGGVLSLERRLKLLRWASASGTYLVEDDYDSEFRYEGKPVAAMQGLDRSGRVIYVGTFSKVLCPAMRLAYMVVPPALVEPIAALKFLTDYPHADVRTGGAGRFPRRRSLRAAPPPQPPAERRATGGPARGQRGALGRPRRDCRDRRGRARGDVAAALPPLAGPSDHRGGSAIRCRTVRRDTVLPPAACQGGAPGRVCLPR